MSDNMKFDDGKPPLGLLPREFLEETAGVLAFGANKYSANRWRQGMEWQRLLDAALRHVNAFNDGEDLDPESGLSHLAHASCCMAFLITYQAKGHGDDNRYKEPKVKTVYNTAKYKDINNG